MAPRHQQATDQILDEATYRTLREIELIERTLCPEGRCTRCGGGKTYWKHGTGFYQHPFCPPHTKGQTMSLCPQNMPDCPGFGPTHHAHLHAHLPADRCCRTDCDVPAHDKPCRHLQIELIPGKGARCTRCYVTATFDSVHRTTSFESAFAPILGRPCTCGHGSMLHTRTTRLMNLNSPRSDRACRSCTCWTYTPTED